MSSPPDPVDAATSCITNGEPMALLRIYQFQDDVEAHDDALQDHLANEFDDFFFEAARVLEGAFGHRNVLDIESEVDLIPLCGVFRAATWSVEGKCLFLAAAHEDRETPFLLIVGVAK